MSDSRESGPARHAGRPTRPLVLTAEQRAAVEVALRPATAEQRVVRRARAILLMAEGYTAGQIALRVDGHVRSVETRRARFDRADPASRVADAPRPGRQRSFVRAA